ncbi:MAG: hypothetical protein ACPL3C_04585 [Pyrobaculum sp.]
MNNWLVFAIAFAATAAVLLATVAANVYPREPVHKPYWDNPQARQKIITDASSIGVLASRGQQGVVVLGYRDQLNATNRAELLTAIKEVLNAARGYTVYIAPWATDNATKAYLSLLYDGRLPLEDYLKGVVTNSTAISPRVEQALALAGTIAQTYGTYQPLGGAPQAQIPPIYVAVFRNDTSYVVYEPFTLGRDRTYTDWLQWVKTAFENLRQGQGKVTP